MFLMHCILDFKTIFVSVAVSDVEQQVNVLGNIILV